MLASVDETDTFVLQLEKELEARKQAIKWEKEFEEHQPDDKVCLKCRKRVPSTEKHKHKVYDLQEDLQTAKNNFQKMIQEHKRRFVEIEESLAELQKEKELVQKKLRMCNTGIFALAELDRQVTGDAKTVLAGLETFNKHFGDIKSMVLPMNYCLTEILEDACYVGKLSTIHWLLKLLDNFPVSGKISYSNQPTNIAAAVPQLDQRRIVCEN